MAESIRVTPESVWGFWRENSKRLQEKMLLLASNQDYGSAIYLSEEDGFPQFTVYVDDDPVEVTSVCTAAECEKTAKEIYDRYLTSGVVLAFIDRELDLAEEEEDRNEDAIDDNEDNLDAAFMELMDKIAGDECDRRDFSEICDDLKEHVCEYLYRKHNIDVYRPMYLEDDRGERFFVEYPYGCMVFEGPDNPLYQD